ncbi:MAG: metallophosphoesterase [Lachnospiraceae bacterium]|nr:metallophosphoesterase [Lachnospiraceae bacterium]
MFREKIMWLAIFAVSVLAAIAAALYLAKKIENTGVFAGINSRPVTKVLSVTAVIAAAVILCLLLDIANTIVIFTSVAVFMLVGDLVGLIMRKTSSSAVRPGIIDAMALTVCTVYLVIGWILMHGMWETDYSLSTTKNVGTITVAHIADSHVGCGFSGKGFAERLEKIQLTEPDVLVITGDFVDDDTMLSDMKDACAALGKFKAKYGVYYCLGNHDMGYYSSGRRGYTGEQLIQSLEQNGVTVLKDESVLIDDRFYITGRLDADYGRADRLDMADLVKDLDKEKYIIVLDHQPTDYDNEAAADVDLVLSGHTHGGQLFPLEYIQPLISRNNNVRGHERRGNTDFIVTDGISDWAVKFRTGCRSEFCLINITSL